MDRLSQIRRVPAPTVRPSARLAILPLAGRVDKGQGDMNRCDCNQNKKFLERMKRASEAIGAIRRELDDRGPRLMPCATPGCTRLTRARFCLVCAANKEKIELP
jgi:hypothetical protein